MTRLPDGTVALVTGAGQGIGAAVASALAADGAKVVLAGRTIEKLQAVASRISESGGTAHTIAVDVTDPDQVANLAAAAVEFAGPVGILVNNAGVGYSSPLKRTTPEDWRRVMDTNATGTFLCTRELLPGMVAARWGRVISIASVAGLSGGAYLTAYSASKHAVIGFTRSLAAEVASHGVTVNAVCPGFVATPMTDSSVANIMAVTGKSQAEALQALESTSPQQRLIEPEEVAHAVSFLASEASRGINGQAIVIDGGGLLA